jgi:hypothetical protein
MCVTWLPLAWGQSLYADAALSRARTAVSYSTDGEGVYADDALGSYVEYLCCVQFLVVVLMIDVFDVERAVQGFLVHTRNSGVILKQRNMCKS